jgi:hypothetical protein
LADDFQLKYPPNIKRVLNLASINESLLQGGLTEKKIDLDRLYLESSPINTTTFIVTAGVPMILKTKSLNTYRVIETGPIYGSNYYTIQVLATSLGFDEYHWRSDYEFFVAQYWQDQQYVNNVIDWTNEKNTLFVQPSALNTNWTTDEGILETMLSYELYKGLDLLNQ